MYKIINKKKLLATMIADMVGYVLFAPRILCRKTETISPEEVRSILIIRTAYIGDVVMTLPILKPLRERFTRAKMSFLTSASAKPILENNPYLDEIIVYDPFWFYPTDKGKWFPFIKKMRKRRFDLIIEARADIRELALLVFPIPSRYKVSYKVGGGAYLLTHVVPYPGLTHKVDYHLNIAGYLGCATDFKDNSIYLNDSENRKVAAILARAGVGGPFAVAHPGSRVVLKRWPWQKCVLLYDKIIDNLNVELVLVGSSQEKGLIDKITNQMGRKTVSLAGSLNLRELTALLSEATFFICNDSAPMHIAAAMGTPVIAIFGPSKSVETGPYQENKVIVEKNYSCRLTCDEERCHHQDYHVCMQSIEVEDVFQATMRLVCNAVIQEKNGDFLCTHTTELPSQLPNPQIPIMSGKDNGQYYTYEKRGP